MSDASGSSWLKGLKEDYQTIFIDVWSPYLGAVLLVMVMAVLIGSGLFWGVFGGIKLWGDYLNNAVGLGPLLGISPQLESVLLHRLSLLDITLVIGAFSAALFSRQFRIIRPPVLEVIWAAVGGTLMGLGATLAGGCTVGGFFMPLTFSSYAGWVMWIGLLLGAAIGLKLLIWTLENISWGMNAPKMKPARFKQWYPWLGLLVVVLIMVWAVSWWGSGNDRKAGRALLVLSGFGIGFILHRSRFCFSKVFREPVMTGHGEMTKAMMLAIALAVPVGAALIARGTIDPYVVIPTRFWIGSLLGGFVFGIGMIFAGGCASGALWRMSEGHIKLLVVVVFIAWSGSTANALLSKAGWLTTDFDLEFMNGIAEVTRLGVQAFMPDMMGSWGGSMLLTYGLLVFWYLLVRYNESTGRFIVFK